MKRTGLLDRRTILRGAGGATVALPLLDAMLTLGGKAPGVAHGASAGAPPRRLVIMYTGEGFPMAQWRPIGAKNSSDFRLSELLQPLAPHQGRSLFIEGVPMASSYDARQR